MPYFVDMIFIVSESEDITRVRSLKFLHLGDRVGRFAYLTNCCNDLSFIFNTYMDAGTHYKNCFDSNSDQ